MGNYVTDYNILYFSVIVTSDYNRKEEKILSYIKHTIYRMNQRGISKEMILLTLQYGQNIEDKIILNVKSMKRLISKVNTILKSKLLKILNKGCIAEILSDDASVIL